VIVAPPPRGPETEQERDLEHRGSDLEALIEEARRRARRRRLQIGTAIVIAAAGLAGIIGSHGGDGGGGPTALAGDSDARSQSSALSASLAALPFGNEAMAFAFDPSRPNIAYVASPHARGGTYVFKTTDYGRHWSSTRARGAGWESDILSLTADPRNPGTLYAGTDTAVYKSVDGGRSWRPFRQGLFPLHSGQLYNGKPGTANWNRNNGWVLDVAVDPADSRIVYTAAGGVRKSTNGGRTWKTVFARKKWTFVTRIAIASTEPESIYAIGHVAASGATTIYKSTNAGTTWHATGPGLPSSCCGDSQDALTVDSGNPQRLYAAVGDTVFATTDGGASWRPIANGLPAKAVTSLAADPRRPGTLYASTEISHSYKTKDGHGSRVAGGIYKTTDGGRTWTQIWSGFGVGKVAVNPKRPSTIYAAGWAGGAYPSRVGRCGTHPSCFWKFPLLRSTDGGRTWAVAER
jgi:photosystem II stability/assembly factor-like uncharacterized protein